MENNLKSTNSTGKKSMKQVLALALVVILVLLYLATFLLAIFDPTSTGRMFQACLFATIGLPILLWIYLGIYGHYSKKHTIADLDLMKDVELPEDTDQ